MTIYKVIGYNKFGGRSGQEKLFTSYKAAYAFKKTCKPGNPDGAWQNAEIYYKYKEHKKDGWLEEIYIGPSNW